MKKTISEQPSPWRKSSKRKSCYGDQVYWLPMCDQGRRLWFRRLLISDGGMIRLETLIELEFINSSCSSLLSHWKKTDDSLSSDSSRQHLNQQYPPPLLWLVTVRGVSRRFATEWEVRASIITFKKTETRKSSDDCLVRTRNSTLNPKP